MKVKAAHVDEIAEGKSKCVKLDQLRILLIREKGEIFALENRCPHFGLSMEKGAISNGSITCPWHGWRFDVCTGQSPVIPTAKVDRLDVIVEGNDVKVQL